MVTDVCLIYSNFIETGLFTILTAELEFNNLPSYIFAGTKQIIEGFLNYNNSEFSEKKHLKIYKCNLLSSSFKYSEGEMELANINDLDNLISMNISFKLEYDGENVN